MEPNWSNSYHCSIEAIGHDDEHRRFVPPAIRPNVRMVSMANVALDLATDIQPVSDFRANASAMLEHVKETGRPLVLTRRGRGAAVLLDISTFQDLLDELEELRDVQRSLVDVAAGDLVDHEGVKSAEPSDITEAEEEE